MAAAAALVAAVLPRCESVLCAAAPAITPGPPAYPIRWVPDPANSNKLAVEVAGLGAATLTALREANWERGQWQRLLSVYTDQGDLIGNVGLPAMAGEYQVMPDALRFEPQFALQPGIRYRAVFTPGALPGKSAAKIVASAYLVPATERKPTTVVANVFPSAEVLPENLLKFYVHFSAPMSGGHIYNHIHLRDEAGKSVELPFLEIDEELWNPSMTRLTLFIDPGRIKRGVQPLEEVGPALEEGKSYSLVIDASWRDAMNVPLKHGFEKRFKVGPTDRTAIDPAKWRIEAPSAGTRSPLAVTFAEPLDHALALRVIRVMDDSNRVLDGMPALGNAERRWTFLPSNTWKSGSHAISVQTTIEDLAGNNIGKSFEVDLFEGVQRRFTNSTVKLPFRVP